MIRCRACAKYQGYHRGLTAAKIVKNCKLKGSLIEIVEAIMEINIQLILIAQIFPPITSDNACSKLPVGA